MGKGFQINNFLNFPAFASAILKMAVVNTNVTISQNLHHIEQ